LWDSLGKARLHEFVKNLPDGINTSVGESGDRLSGGQRQRVALARAFYYGRDVLVMDEATSALDPLTEHEIIDDISRQKGKMTVIIITHKMKNIENCDRVYKLKSGSISIV
jgi:ABC-type bacteriocin/lantibiotic exporter with double-glycine peptidase domain